MMESGGVLVDQELRPNVMVTPLKSPEKFWAVTDYSESPKGEIRIKVKHSIRMCYTVCDVQHVSEEGSVDACEESLYDAS